MGAPPAEIPHQIGLGVIDTQLGLRIKAPKLIVGPLELGFAGEYALGSDDQKASLCLDRFKAQLSIKDVFFRGKLGLEDWRTGKIHYSKKFRVPYTNTELLKVQMTAAFPGTQSAGGLLGRGLGVTFSLHQDKQYRSSVVRKAPDYSLQLQPRVGLPQSVYDKMGFPGSAYFKASTTLHLADAASLRGARLQLDVHSLTAVVRLQRQRDVPHKPCRVGRNLMHAARRLTLEDAEAEEEKRQVRAAVKVARVLEAESPPTPDIIDKAAAKAREWAHAVLVNTCVATKHLQESAGAAGERLRTMVAGGGGSGSDAAKKSK